MVELEEPVDEPGTTIGTKIHVLHCIRQPFSKFMGISVIFAEFSEAECCWCYLQEAYCHE